MRTGNKCSGGYVTVHAPLQATPTYLDRYKHIADDRRRRYAAMMSAMDDAVGAVMQKLRATGRQRGTTEDYWRMSAGQFTTSVNESGAVYCGRLKRKRWPSAVTLKIFD